VAVAHSETSVLQEAGRVAVVINAKPTEQVPHGAYRIEPTPHHLNGAGPWTQGLRIARAEPGGDMRVQLFNGPATFPTRAEAVAGCVGLGRDILDGKVADRRALF
jgi:hypothetical protein